MKRIIILLAIVGLAFPGLAKTQQVYDFKPIGHGPLDNNLGTPMSVCALENGSTAVFDASTTSINTYDKSGKLVKKSRIKIESLTGGSIPDDLQFGSFVQPVSFDADEKGSYYLLTQKNLGKLEEDGSTSLILNFSTISPSLSAPMMVHIFKGKFYILDQKLGVVVFDSNGKYEKTIGTIGKGSGKFNNPVNFWVGLDGSVTVLDSANLFGDDDQGSEMLLLMYDHTGSLVKEFGPKASGYDFQDYMLVSPWTGAMSRTAFYLVDLSMKDFQMSWVVKQFNLEGDFVKAWPIVRENKLETPSIIRDVIISMDCGPDNSVCFSMPYAGKLYSDPTAFTLIAESSPNSDVLKLPSSAVTSSSGNTYVLDVYPPVIRMYDAEGKLAKQKEIKDNFSAIPGMDLSFGLDLAIAKNEIFVSTGLYVLKIDPSTLEVTGQTDLVSGSMEMPVFISLAWKDGYLAALDSNGKISVTSGGIPITFDAAKEFEAKKITDISFDKNGSILALDTAGRRIGTFTTSGSFQGKLEIDQTVKTPVSFCTLPTGEIAILDSADGQVKVVISNGSAISTIGSKGALMSMTSEKDYATNPGEFYLPSHITSNPEGVLTVVDFGNCRVQKITNSTPPPPEKTPAKLSVTHTKIDFGKVYYENESSTIQIGIENLGQNDMSGIVKTGTGKVKVSPKIITPETKTVTVTFVPDKTMAWRSFSDKLIIETNGGNAELPVTASVIGKTIKMTIGSTDFQVTTDKQDTITGTRSPEIVSGRTYVPLRATGDIFNAKIDWDSTAKKVTLTIDGKTIELWIGKNSASVDGTEVPLSNPPIILKNSTYVPIRFVSEQMGANVEWDAQQKIVTITYPKP